MAEFFESRFITLLILRDHIEEFQKIKKRGSREKFLPENDFQTSFAVDFQ